MQSATRPVPFFRSFFTVKLPAAPSLRCATSGAVAPHNIPARIGRAQNMVARGEIDQAIDEYRKLAGEVPQVRGMLVRLLIVRNQRRLPAKPRLVGDRDADQDGERPITPVQRVGDPPGRSPPGSRQGRRGSDPGGRGAVAGSWEGRAVAQVGGAVRLRQKFAEARTCWIRSPSR